MDEECAGCLSFLFLSSSCSPSCRLTSVDWLIFLQISVGFGQLGAQQLSGRGRGTCSGIYFSPCRVSMGWPHASSGGHGSCRAAPSAQLCSWVLGTHLGGVLMPALGDLPCCTVLTTVLSRCTDRTCVNSSCIELSDCTV